MNLRACFLTLLLASLCLPGQGWASESVVFRQSERLQGQPLRIVSLEDITTEMLLSLGIVPVGVGGLESYQSQGRPLGERLEGSVSLGTSQQPNLERLVRLEPDLVIGTSSLHSGLFERLDSLAPTLLYRVAMTPSKRDAIEQGADMLRHLARLTGREAEAKQVLNDLARSIAEGRRAARGAGVEGKPLAVLYPLPDQGLFIVSNEQTLVVSLANRLGGSNPWPLRDGATIHQRIEVHELARIPDLHLMFIGDFRGNAMFESPLWRALPVARNHDAGFLPSRYWSFGGPLSARILMQQMTALIREQWGSGTLSEN